MTKSKQGVLATGLTLLAAFAATLGAPTRADAQNCLSPNPADWPPPAKPYFMLVVDTSGSMTACTTPPTAYPMECNQAAAGYALNSCGMVPNRINDAKCALRKTVQAFSGQVNFGLSTYAFTLTGCANSGACVSECGTPTGGNCSSDDYQCTVSAYPDSGGSQCGNVPFCNNGAGPPAPAFGESTWRNGGNVVVPMKQDPLTGPPATDNTPELLEWFDGLCNNNREIWAAGGTPIAGSLESVAMYLRTGWRIWDQNGNSPAADSYCPNLTFTYGTPMNSADPGCRPVNVILVTDGDDTCDGQAPAVAAAQDLFQNGVTIGGTTWPVRVHVVNFAGGTQANTDAIAAAGGTTSSLFATNEVQLAQALSNIISGAVGPETCDNIDNNCNGCIDEGYSHYCNTNPTCCAWGTAGQRQTCLTNYQASITPANPNGNVALLPCTTAAQSNNPATWLCFNPGDVCDETDNNCNAVVDENQTKCGTPAHCPLPETCNSQDDNCNGVADEGGVCGTCVPSPEVCDGCDNDCDGITDDGIAPVVCGLPSPANCAGTKSCSAPQAVPPGGCIAGGGFGACSNNPQTEICDGIDNNCNGLIDDGVAPVACVPVGTPPGLIYGGNSQCQMGVQACGGACIGFVGPSIEVCDGIDNDCNGVVDDGPTGVGQQCGVSSPPCTPGTTACVGGAIVCSGGTQPTGEVCDGVDNNCNGQVDETPLTDAPGPGMNGCWALPGNCCSHAGLNWCPPPGGTCNGVGTLTAPCSIGTLQCQGALGWSCLGGTPPSAEVCDGVDNDCNGTLDNGPFPMEGQACGINAPAVAPGCTPGDCQQGVIACAAGVLDCIGDVGPAAELCNAKDDNCNGQCDDGIPVGGSCTPVYDTVAYPGPRNALPCQPGTLQCDGMGGLVCIGGTGPSPEVCDGINNDCDGATDEIGAGPDGINGTAAPNDPTKVIGQSCPADLTAVCSPGLWACNPPGLVECVGADTGTFESCDCQDNDCNGITDNQNPNNTPPLCSAGKSCVNANGSCQCATPCQGEFCPAGQVCTDVVSSETGTTLGKFCVSDTCGNCATKSVLDGMGNLLCGPAGSVGQNCDPVPQCVCKGQSGCQAPCHGVSCNSPQICTNFGPNAGQCVVNNCFNAGCPGCDKACADSGECVDNPCANANCAANEVCKPSADFLTFSCVGSCAGVTCESGSICKDGMCVATCVPPCQAGEVCDHAQNPPGCVADLCQPDSCPNGGCCDPITGACGNCPCEGIICPMDQVCQAGECVGTTMGQGGGSSTGATGSTGSGTTGSGGSDGAGGNDDANGVWGLATGGGGCSCSTSGGDDSDLAWLGLAGLALVVSRRRRRGMAGEEVAK